MSLKNRPFGASRRALALTLAVLAPALATPAVTLANAPGHLWLLKHAAAERENEGIEVARRVGGDDGVTHDRNDDRGGKRGGHGKDDGPNHDKNDDHGGKRGGNGKDDASGHDRNDDHGSNRGGGHGKDDGPNHH